MELDPGFAVMSQIVAASTKNCPICDAPINPDEFADHFDACDAIQEASK